MLTEEFQKERLWSTMISHLITEEEAPPHLTSLLRFSMIFIFFFN